MEEAKSEFLYIVLLLLLYLFMFVYTKQCMFKHDNKVGKHIIQTYEIDATKFIYKIKTDTIS